MKAILFDVDGVIIITAEQKDKIIKEVLQKHNLYTLSWVQEMLKLSLNRKVLLEKIYEIEVFDKEAVLSEINKAMEELENNPERNEHVIKFIIDNYEKYHFFTNTSLPRASLERILTKLELSHCFKRLFTGDDGFKKENTLKIINDYSFSPDDILFIDDTYSHIESVAETGVKVLFFSDSDIDIASKIEFLNLK